MRIAVSSMDWLTSLVSYVKNCAALEDMPGRYFDQMQEKANGQAYDRQARQKLSVRPA
jgi:hypothetical protein